MYNPNQIKEGTNTIYQDRSIDFRILDKSLPSHIDIYNSIKHTDGLLPLGFGKKINIRLYSSTASLKIDGYELDAVNQNYLSGNTPFVILENSGKFSPGNVNYLTFEYVKITNQTGNDLIEVKVKISIIQENALGLSSGMTDWASNTYYSIGDDILGPDNRLYNCIISHTSTATFDENYWEREGGIDQTDVDEFEAILFGSGSNGS
jgi:hypothetical protein